MKRLLASALILGLFSMVSFVGCGEESKVETKEKVTTPTGSTTTTETKKLESSGSNPPPSSEGKTAETPK
jgi:hypothetical protein